MGMAAVVALASHMQMEMPMNRSTAVMVLVAMQLEPKGGTHCQTTHYQ